jgi:hypothetical protein
MVAANITNGGRMNRNDFAAGKKEDPEKVAEAEAKAKAEAEASKSKLTGQKMVGEGHAAAASTLIPDSFIKKMDNYLPKKDK